MKYSGIDLHSNNSVVVVSDEVDRVLVRRRVPNDAAAILALLAGHREQLVGVVVESTYNWYWLVDALQAAGYRVHLANTAAIKRYEGLKHSDDEDDAAYLAQLLRLGILPSGYICPPAARAVRDLARKRMQLVRSRTAQVLSVENMLSRETGAGMRSRAVQRLTAHAVEGFGFNPEVEQSMCANVAVIKTLNREIDKLEQRLHQCVRLRPEFRLLTSVPGIGQTLATLIMLEVGTISALPRWATLLPTRGVWTVRASPMARRRGRATSRMATRTWLGRSWKQRTLPTVIVRKPGASMNARRRGPTASSPPRRWRTSWRAPAITCSRRTSRST